MVHTGNTEKLHSFRKKLHNSHIFDFVKWSSFCFHRATNFSCLLQLVSLAPVSTLCCFGSSDSVDYLGFDMVLRDLQLVVNSYSLNLHYTFLPIKDKTFKRPDRSDGNTKKKILSSIFSKKIVLEKSRVATYEFTTPINVLINASKVLKSSDKDKRSIIISCFVWLTR